MHPPYEWREAILAGIWHFAPAILFALHAWGVNHAISGLADLELETKPEEVLAEIHSLQHRPYYKEES